MHTTRRNRPGLGSPHSVLILACLSASLELGAIGCRRAPAGTPISAIPAPAGGATAPRITTNPIRFTDISETAGIRFNLDNGAQGAHKFIETTPGGCALFDYNNDGYLDVLLVQSGPVPGGRSSPAASLRRPPCALFQNQGDGTFLDVTHRAGIDIDQGYGQGVAVADFNNDGWQDVFITAYGSNHLLRNDQGRFTDVTVASGLGGAERGPRWSTSAAWADYDRDGNLDLFVCHYALWSPTSDIACTNPRGERSYCSPLLYKPESPSLYHNNGNGTFSDVSVRAGLSRLKGRGLGVVWLDYDDDGWDDVFVSNDLTPSFLLHNNRNGTFTDVSLRAGVGLMDNGVALAGMGIAVGDYDNNGREDLLVTNFSNQPKVLYNNRDGKAFDNTTYTSGIGSTSLLVLGWGCEFVDYDLDGRLDLVIANGHVNDDVEAYSKGISYRQPKQLFHNSGDGTFEEDSASLGGLTAPSVTRGLAVGDIDNDGDADVLANNHEGPAQLARNDGGCASSWATFRLEGTKSNRDGVGARIWLTSQRMSQFREARSGSSYASHSDQRFSFGLNSATRIESVRVRWPSGREDRAQNLPARRFYLWREGSAPTPDPRARPLKSLSK